MSDIHKLANLAVKLLDSMREKPKAKPFNYINEVGKVVIIASDFSRGESVVHDLRRLNVINEKPEIIVRRDQIRSLHIVKRVVIVNKATFVNRWNEWRVLSTELKNSQVKWVEFEEGMTKDEFIKKVTECYWPDASTTQSVHSS